MDVREQVNEVINQFEKKLKTTYTDEQRDLMRFELMKMVEEYSDPNAKEKTLDPRFERWITRFGRTQDQLNIVLREAARHGIKPDISVVEDEERLGKDVQTISISIVKGILRPLDECYLGGEHSWISSSDDREKVWCSKCGIHKEVSKKEKKK